VTEVRVVVGGSYALADAPEAFRELMSGQATGKLLIRVE